jgi:hypothetical protein
MPDKIHHLQLSWSQSIFTFKRLQVLKTPVSNSGKQLGKKPMCTKKKKNSVISLKRGRKLYLVISWGKKFGPKQGEVTLGWT